MTMMLMARIGKGQRQARWCSRRSKVTFLSAIDALKAEPEPQTPVEGIDPKVAVSWLTDLSTAPTRIEELA